MIWRLATALTMISVGAAGAIGQQPVCHQQTVQVTEVVAVPTVTIVAIPAYFANYNPPQAEPLPKTAASEEVNQAILAELRKMNQKLDQLLAPGPGTGPAPKADDDQVRAVVSRVLGSSCVKCHSAELAEDKGGGFPMFLAAAPGTTGLKSRNDFTPQELRRIRSRVGDHSMPKGGKLTDDEVDKMLTFFKK